MGCSAPESLSAVWRVKRLSNSAMWGRAREALGTCSNMPGRDEHSLRHTRHLLSLGLYFCALFSLCGTLAYLEAAAQRHYPGSHCCQPAPTSPSAEVKLGCADNLNVPCTYHVQQAAEPLLFGRVQGTANFTSAPQPGLTF